MRRFLVIATACCAILAFVGEARAGLYHKDVLGDFDIDKDGYAVPLSFSSFMSMLSGAIETDKLDNPKSKEILRAIQKRRMKEKLTPEETVAQIADLLRLRRDQNSKDEAIKLLGQLKDRPPAGIEFQVLSQWAYDRHLQKQDQEATNWELSALFDYDFPKKLLDLNDKQLTWYSRLERDYYLPFLRHRNQEELNRKGFIRVHDGLDPIFPSAAKGRPSPVLFVGESGKYEAGTIAATEKAKLPKDAIAILQQLVLWDTDDNRLLWQLGELYNAKGDLRSAALLMDLCADYPRSFTNRELLDHRRAIQEETETLRLAEEEKARIEKDKAKEEQDKAQAAEEKAISDAKERRLWVLIGVSTALVFLVYWQAREFLRRWQIRRARGAKLPNQVE